MKDTLMRRAMGIKDPSARYHFAREFVQEQILQIMDRRQDFRNLAFVGGTALRILHDLPRFSEDLDFCLVDPKGFTSGLWLNGIAKELALFGYAVSKSRERTSTVQGGFIRFTGLPFELGLSTHRNENLFVKLEVDTRPPAGFKTEMVVVNKNLFFKTLSYDLPSLFASKLHVLLFRKHDKGRDFYDLLWFLARRAEVNYELLMNAARQTHPAEDKLDAGNLKSALLARIGKVEMKRILNDVQPFLQEPREAELFRKEYFVSAIEKYFGGR